LVSLLACVGLRLRTRSASSPPPRSPPSLTFSAYRLLKHPLTTDEIKNCCEDLKVLGKKDFKTLLKYRAAIREDLGLDVKVDDKEELTERAEVEPLDEEEQITQQVRFFLVFSIFLTH
jgi:hypothetical protein